MVQVLSLEAVIEIHDYQIKKYQGRSGILNTHLLESAVNQPLLEYHLVQADLYQMAAAYCYHIAQNHSFNDGNKRTGFAVMVAFLSLNGIKVIAEEEEALNMILDICTHKKGKKDLEAWIRNVTVLL